MYAFNATDSGLKTASGGFLRAREEAMQLVVCGVRRPVQLEKWRACTGCAERSMLSWRYSVPSRELS